MAQFRVIPPETGTKMCLCQRWSNRLGAPGRRRPVSCPLRLGLHYWAHPQLKASNAEQLAICCSQSGGEIPHSFPSLSFPSPKQFLCSTSIICKPCCKIPAFIFPFVFKGEKKVDDSLGLKSCVIQQMNFLFCFLSLLIYGVQLNIIEAGSWFAVWAI